MALNIWLGIYVLSRGPYFKTIILSPEAQTIAAFRIQCVMAQEL